MNTIQDNGVSGIPEGPGEDYFFEKDIECLDSVGMMGTKRTKGNFLLIT